MTRAEAIARIVESELPALSEGQRADLLLNWWSIDESDQEFNELPEVLRAEMKRGDVPKDTRGPHYDVLLRAALRHRFIGVRNEYLSSRLVSLGRESEDVTGDVEALEECPCCGYRTLSERGGYDICGVCFWEDNGSQELDRWSGPNHMTLREGRENFARIGAVSENATKHVLVDGKARYIRD